MNLKFGIQTHSIREDFAQDPQKALIKVKEIGYDGVEIALNMSSAPPASLLKDALVNAGLECFGLLVGWSYVQPDTIEKTIDYAKEIGTNFIVIGSVPTTVVTTHGEAMAAVEYMCDILKKLTSCGISTGYHNHDTDFTHTIDGKPFFEYVFENTPEEFIMLLDTGNTKAGGYEPYDILKKYPNRSPYLHIKGYSKEKGYLAYIGEDDIDWESIIDLAINNNGSRIFNVEFGARSDYIPFERAAAAFNVISPMLKKYQS